MGIYDFTVKDTMMNDVRLSKYQGKALLIVNTATGCGFTPQYEGLEKLYKTYKDRGFEILDFPCNQFMRQAPGTNEEIAKFCQLKYGVTFQTFAKIKVNGKDADPLYHFLKNESGNLKPYACCPFKNMIVDKKIEWNFTKFLIDRQGNVIGRFAPAIKPEVLTDAIEDALNKQ
jgi:glutathione peroxidase